MSMNVYAEIPPMRVVRIVAGMRALGAFPNAAMPVDKYVVCSINIVFCFEHRPAQKIDMMVMIDTHLQAN